MKTKALTLVIVTTILVTTSCDFYFPCIKGDGMLVTESRDIGEFTGVASFGNFMVEIFNNEDYSLKIEADENLLPYIDSYVRGGNLILETKRGKCIKSREQLKIMVGAPEIRLIRLGGSGNMYCDMIDSPDLKLELNGSGNIHCSEVNTEDIEIRLSGSGEIRINGSSGSADINLTGSGNVRASDLETNTCNVNLAGSGNVFIRVIDYLEARITGSGNIYYKGQPEIKSTITGSGNIRKN